MASTYFWEKCTATSQRETKAKIWLILKETTAEEVARVFPGQCFLSQHGKKKHVYKRKPSSPDASWTPNQEPTQTVWGHCSFADRMNVTFELEFPIAFQHPVNDMTNSFKRSENMNNFSNVEIVHLGGGVDTCAHCPANIVIFVRVVYSVSCGRSSW